MRPSLKYVLIVALSTCFAVELMSQEDVTIPPILKYQRSEVGGTVGFIGNNSSPYSFGGGFYLSYHESLKNNNKIELGVQFDYNFMKKSSIYFDDASDFFNNSGSISRLNMVTSFHPYRLKNIDIYTELYTGFLFSSGSSTYYIDDDDDEGNLEKLKIYPAFNLGIGLGIELYKRISVKAVYHQSNKVKQAVIDDVRYENGLIFPFEKAPLGSLNIYLAVTIGKD